jgi:hypothetical protein
MFFLAILVSSEGRGLDPALKNVQVLQPSLKSPSPFLHGVLPPVVVDAILNAPKSLLIDAGLSRNGRILAQVMM